MMWVTFFSFMCWNYILPSHTQINILIYYLLLKVYNDHQYDFIQDFDEVLPLNMDSIHKHRHERVKNVMPA
jgi:hypothetical protein